MASNRKQTGYLVVDERGGQVGVLVDAEEYARLHEAARELEKLRGRGKRTGKARRARYDFSDLTGMLTWKGDAVAEQRRLRDEW